MAQVPIYDDFKVKLDPLRPVMQKTPDVSSGLQALAKGMGDAADSWDRIEYREAQSQGFKALATRGEAWAQKDIELRNKYRGDNAAGYAEEATKWWKEQHDALSAELSPRARALTSKQFGQMRLSATTNGLAYVEREKENAAEVNYTSAQSVITNQAGTTLPLDAAIKQVTDNAVQRFAVLGFGEGLAKEHARKYVTDAIANNVTRLLDKPDAARTTLEKYKDQMDNDVYTRLNEAVKTSETKVAGVALGKAIVQGSGPAGTDFESIVSHVLATEGGYVANDAGKGETNYGINTVANPDLDIKNLTPGKARDIYKQRYWNAIGADSLPPAVRAIAFDAAVNQGVSFANKIIAEANGDPAKMLDLRRQKYQSLVKANPEKYGRFANSWESRLRALEPRSGKPSVSDMITQARAHADPEVANIAERTVREEASLSEMREREAYATDLQTAQDFAFKEVGGWRNVPADLMARLKPADKANLIEGPPKESDPDTMLQLQNRPELWNLEALQERRVLLAESDYRAFYSKFAALASKDKSKIEAVKVDNDQYKDILTKAGMYYLMTSDNKENKQEMINLRALYEREIDAKQQAIKRPLTMEEKNTLLKQLVKPVKEARVRTGSLFGMFDGPTSRNRRAYQVEDPADIIVPADARQTIVEKMKAAGVTPTEQQIRQAYLHMD